MSEFSFLWCLVVEVLGMVMLVGIVVGLGIMVDNLLDDVVVLLFGNIIFIGVIFVVLIIMFGLIFGVYFNLVVIFVFWFKWELMVFIVFVYVVV